MRRLAPFAAFILLAAGLWAFDFSAVGLSPAGTSVIDGRSFTRLTDPSGGTLFFASEVEPSDARVAALKAIVASIRSWKTVQPSQIRAINFADSLEVLVMPSSFKSGDLDLTRALPSGIHLFYNGGTTYDFKVKSGQYIVRVRALYTGEDDLVAHAVDAYRNPQTYAAAYDPAALVKRLLAVESLAASEAGKIKALEARTAGDDTAIAALQKRVDRDETALMASLNGGTPVNPASIARLVELKRNDPSLGKASAATQLEADKLGLKPGELDIAFFVLFGER
ncbi:MAG TPA: hypothetical protein VMV90_01675 [Rectinemataceae bacterium]|nr:hypothetical protein [Rectinemataceae bacterium]